MACSVARVSQGLGLLPCLTHPAPLPSWSSGPGAQCGCHLTSVSNVTSAERRTEVRGSQPAIWASLPGPAAASTEEDPGGPAVHPRAHVERAARSSRHRVPRSLKLDLIYFNMTLNEPILEWNGTSDINLPRAQRLRYISCYLTW